MSFMKTTSGINWHYTLRGQGECLVFIHGWAADSRTWGQQITYFANNYHVLTVDLPGHGKSSWVNITLSQLAADIAEIINKLEIKKVHLIGSSFGGLVALSLLKQFPQKVKKLIFADALPKFSKSEDFPFGLEIPRIRKLASQLDEAYPAILNIFFRSLFTPAERESGKVKWLLSFKNEADAPQREALKALLKAIEKEDLRDVLKRLDIPFLFLTGSEDYICSKESAAVLVRDIRNASFKIFDGCGHFPFISKADEFNQTLEAFLRQ